MRRFHKPDILVQFQKELKITLKYLNSQKYKECQLIAAINAAAYLGRPRISPNSDEYEWLVDVMGAREKPPSDDRVLRVDEFLGVYRTQFEPTWDNIVDRLDNRNPVVVAIYKEKASHAFLLTDYAEAKRIRFVELHNFNSWAPHRWLEWHNVKRIMPEWCENHCYYFRSLAGNGA